MKNHSIFKILIITLLVNGILTLGIIHITKPKIAYVRSGKILEDFKGAHEGKAMFQAKIQPLESKIDSLKLLYDNYLSLFSPNRLEELKQIDDFRVVAQSLQYYTKQLETESIKYEEKYSEGVLNQLNSQIEIYGSKNKFEMILGTTDDGNILYAVDAVDITDDLIESINSDY